MASLERNSLQPRNGRARFSWTVRWRRPGQKHQAEKTFQTKAAAEMYKAKVELGMDGQGDRQTTVLDAAEDMLREYDGLVKEGLRKPCTLREKDAHVRNHIAPHEFAGRLIAETGTADIKDHLKELMRRGVSRHTARAVLVTIRLTWEHAVEKRVIPDSHAAAAAMVRLKGKNTKRKADPASIPPKADIRELFAAAAEAAEQDRGRRHAMVRIIAHAGLRSGELRALMEDSLILDKRPRVIVRRSADRKNNIFEKPKTDAGFRTVPLPPQAVSALRAWMVARPHTDDGFIFPSETGGLWTYERLYRVWCLTLRDASLATHRIRQKRRRKGGRDLIEREKVWEPEFSPHTLRHVFASAHIETGAKPKWIQEMMGHESLQMTMDLYGHLWPSTDQDLEQAARAAALFD
ncbi:tyrosine-type recombinase/integrase [Maricaulis maris]|uniref:tyrosine-type recombinase/integrase n=1 Tax=Maricaulis maris TaxID=74318 RepID=UPI003B8B1479